MTAELGSKNEDKGRQKRARALVSGMGKTRKAGAWQVSGKKKKMKRLTTSPAS